LSAKDVEKGCGVLGLCMLWDYSGSRAILMQLKIVMILPVFV
jgi:hypothetical protein